MILTLVDYKSYLNVTGSDTDDILESIAEGVESEIQRFLGFNLESEELTEYFDGGETSVLVLNEFPVTSIDSIYRWDGIDWLELTTDDYYSINIKNQSSIYADNYIFVKGIMNYKVTYTAGYTDIPSDIQSAMKKLTRLRWDETPFGQNRLGLTSKTNQGGIQSSLNFKANEERDIFRSIEGYRHINV